MSASAHRLLSAMVVLLAVALALPAASASSREELVAAFELLRKGRLTQAVERTAAMPAGAPERAYMEYKISLDRLDAGDPEPAEKTRATTPSQYVRSELGKILAEHYIVEGNQSGFRRIRTEIAGELGHGVQCADSIFSPPSADELKRLWYAVTPGAHKACDALFKSAARSGALAQDDIWRRLRLVAGMRKLKAARKIQLLLPRGERPSVRQLSSAIYRAVRRIRAKHNLDTRARREMVAVSAMVAARSDPALAERRWSKFAQYFPGETNDDVWLAIAEWSAKFHRKGALGLFRKVALDKHGETARAWRVRAGLRLADWEDVELVTNAMPPEQAQVTAWRYWRAHALLELGRREEGSGALQALAREADDYYGLLARERLGSDLIRAGAALAPAVSWSALEEVDFDLAVARAADWVGRPWQGLKIWQAALARLPADRRHAAAVLADREEWHLASTVASDTLSGNAYGLNIRFPTPYFDLVSKYSDELGLDIAFVYGLMRQESRFMPNAVSYANAQGLMQILPATAKNVARKNKFTKYRRSRLKRPDTNIIIGTHYLDELRRSLGDDPILVAAGYNAGPGRPKRWKSRNGNIDRIVYVENIPITQTRLYVKHLIANAAYYDHRLELREPSILGRVAGSY